MYPRKWLKNTRVNLNRNTTRSHENTTVVRIRHQHITVYVLK